MEWARTCQVIDKVPFAIGEHLEQFNKMWPAYILLFVQNMAWKSGGIINYLKWLSLVVKLCWVVECAFPPRSWCTWVSLQWICPFVSPKKSQWNVYEPKVKISKNIGLKTYGWGFRKKVETWKSWCEGIPLGPIKIQFFCNESVSIWDQDARYIYEPWNANFFGIKQYSWGFKK